jgi:hypothetical protein
MSFVNWTNHTRRQVAPSRDLDPGLLFPRASTIADVPLHMRQRAL